jgi:hypothetical protein
MNPSDIHRDLGRMEGRLDAVEDRLSEMKAVLERIDERLAKIESAARTSAVAPGSSWWRWGASCRPWRLARRAFLEVTTMIDIRKTQSALGQGL